VGEEGYLNFFKQREERAMHNQSMKKKITGQGMTEYIIIVALIAVAAIAAFTMFGDVVRGQVGTMAAELGGQASTKSRAATDKAGKSAEKKGAKHATLADYQDQGGNTGAGVE